MSAEVSRVFARRLSRAHQAFYARVQKAVSENLVADKALTPWQAWRDWSAYATDFAQRAILFWDTLRQRGNNFIEHERAGLPPLLHFQYEMLVDGRTLAHPVNHALVRIVPTAEYRIDDRLRPFVIVDPRAGHGPGIGGFKQDSEVGVALAAGHPVYFVIFFPDPEPGQTLADVCQAEALFVQTVAERHPKSPKPVIVGNCQGGWAVILLAALQPHITGPIVLNGAPMSYWAGNDGENPMRYAGGLLGGSWLASLASDLGHGKFDGAHLVQNFENLNPANTFWEKYYHLFANIDEEPARFLEFERWWGGFYLMNQAEIRWIVDNLFVGNRLAAGEAKLGAGQYFDIKAIRSPIVIFASMGDNITPPQQAFNWIADVYTSTEEIKANGQVIVGLLHEDIGHLGIFVSGRVAKKEHAQIVEVLKYIQQLPPGLYGMEIKEIKAHDGNARYEVSLTERRLEDLRRFNKYDRRDEKPFAAVAAVSDLNERAYRLFVHPIAAALSSEQNAKWWRDFHPLRWQRWALSDRNPWLWPLPVAAQTAKSKRQPSATSNVGNRFERAVAEAISASLELHRAVRDAVSEAAFFQIYGNLFIFGIADNESRRADRVDLREQKTVREMLASLEKGGYREAIARMGLLLIKAGGGVRQLAGLQKSWELIRGDRLLRRLSEDDQRRLLHEQTIIIEFEPERAKSTLPYLLPREKARKQALVFLDQIESHFPLNRAQETLLAEFRRLLQRDAAVLANARKSKRIRSPAKSPPTR